jgi:hypothetical protein
MKEKALGKLSELIPCTHISFQKSVEVPSPIVLDAMPLKIGVSLVTSIHQKGPQGGRL